jgi:poly-beta-1,6-N-acetyl-D-glucosamine synthase
MWLLHSAFWICLALLIYALVGYPLLIRAWSHLRPRTFQRGNITPAVSVIVVARNEGQVIGRRVRNLLDLDYPRDDLEILIGSDGSTDGTAGIARRTGGSRVRVVEFPERRGKASMLNDLISLARGEILVLGDARQRFSTSALRALVAPFKDSRVGVVSGELLLTDPASATTISRGVGFYWRYEKSIRRSESAVDSTVGATGAIYALRRRLFEPIAPDTILDDVLLPMNAVRRGYRIVFEPAACAYDRVASRAVEEFTRKVRTIAGNFQLLLREHWLLNPLRNRLWFQTVSHKALRLCLPLLFAGLFVSAVALLHAPFYRWALGGQVAFYAAAVVGHDLQRRGKRSRLFAIPHVVCMLNWATLIAFVRFMTGAETVMWASPTHPEVTPDQPGMALPQRRSA